jgi:hypothetical protein
MSAAQETGWTVKPHHSGRFRAGRIAYPAPRDEPESGAPPQCNSAVTPARQVVLDMVTEYVEVAQRFAEQVERAAGT